LLGPPPVGDFEAPPTPVGGAPHLKINVSKWGGPDMPIFHKYPLPGFLEGVVPVSKYDKWLNCKADTLRKRDLRLKRPCAYKNSKAAYKAKIHAAVFATGTKDQYTGDDLRYDLIGKWNNKKDKGEKIKDEGEGMKDEIIKTLIIGVPGAKQAEKVWRLMDKGRKLKGGYGAFSRDFFLLPTVDHSDPYGSELEFEICSWLVNTSKTLMNPEEFIGFCKKVVKYHK
jgi:hypothetical protein